MRKRWLSLICLAVFLLISSGAAWAGGPAIWHTVKNGETIQTIARNNFMTVSDVLDLNKNLRFRKKNEVRVGEDILINPSADTLLTRAMRWQKVGGDPFFVGLLKWHREGQDSLVFAKARELLREEVPMMSDVPEAVKAKYLTLVEAQYPEFTTIHSTPDNPHFFWGQVFGGVLMERKRNGRMAPTIKQYWEGPVYGLWVDPRTRRLQSDQEALVYQPVAYGDTLWQLVLVLACGNATNNLTILPPAPVVIETLPEIVIAAPESVIVAEPESTVVESTTAIVSNPNYADLVIWLVGEHTRVRRDGNQTNGYAGFEFTKYESMYKRFGGRVRASVGEFEIGHRNNFSGDYNLGLVVAPISTSAFRWDAEGGVGWTHQQRWYLQSHLDNQGGWHGEEKKLWTDGPWWYVRSQLITPWAYADMKYRDGRSVREFGGYLTLTPGWLYAKAAANRQIRKSTTRHLDGLTIPFAADTMDMVEGRLGLRFGEGRYTIYGSLNVWKFYGADYWSTRKGPGVGFEWYPGSPNWRIEGGVISFNTTEHARWMYGNSLTDRWFYGHENRYKLGIVIIPAH